MSYVNVVDRRKNQERALDLDGSGLYQLHIVPSWYQRANPEEEDIYIYDSLTCHSIRDAVIYSKRWITPLSIYVYDLDETVRYTN